MMDKKLALLKISMLAYAILVLGLSISNHLEAVIGITIAAYCVLGYRKFKRFKKNQFAAGTVS